MVVLGILTYIALNDRTSINKYNLITYFTVPAILAMFFGQSKVEIIGVSLPLILYAIDKSDIKHYGKGFVNFIGKHTLEIYLAQCVAIEALSPSVIISLIPDDINLPKAMLWIIAMLIEILLTIILSYVLHIIQSCPEYVHKLTQKS